MNEEDKTTDELLREILKRLDRIEQAQPQYIFAPMYPMPYPVYVPQPVYVPVPVAPLYPTTAPYPVYPSIPPVWCENTTSGNTAGYIS